MGCTFKEYEYEESWSKIDFESYENMTQEEFQDAMAPYQMHGSAVPIDVPKGWRRVEGTRLGKFFYVHMETGTICKYPRDIYHCGKEMWIDKDGNPSNFDKTMTFEEKARDMGREGGAKPTKAVQPRVVPTKVQGQAQMKENQPPATQAVAAAPKDLPAPLPVALLFPGQGSQYVKMLSEAKEIPAVKDMLAKAKGVLGYDILEVMTNGPESKLSETRYCQPAMYIGGLAGVEKLRQTKPECIDRVKAVAGLSLGEYTALTLAGVWTFEEGLRLVKLRGEAMQEAATATEQAMLSVAGLEQDVLDDLCKKATQPGEVCQIANFLFPKGFSCAGNLKSIVKLEELAKGTKGVLQAKVLKTGGAFHTPLMAAAKTKLDAALNELKPKMQPPRCIVYANVSAKAIPAGSSPDVVVDSLSKQLTACVLWEPSVRTMIADGIENFFECGPNKQLHSMMKRIDQTSWERMAITQV